MKQRAVIRTLINLTDFIDFKVFWIVFKVSPRFVVRFCNNWCSRLCKKDSFPLFLSIQIPQKGLIFIFIWAAESGFMFDKWSFISSADSFRCCVYSHGHSQDFRNTESYHCFYFKEINKKTSKILQNPPVNLVELAIKTCICIIIYWPVSHPEYFCSWSMLKSLNMSRFESCILNVCSDVVAAALHV